MIVKNDFLSQLEKITFLRDINPASIVDVEHSFKKSNETSWDITIFDNKEELADLKNIVGMSSLANAKIINLICKSLSPNESYVNIGTYQGFSFIAGLIGTACKAEGVDNFSQFLGPRDIFLKNYDQYKRQNTQFFDQNYVEYLKNKTNPIDFYFYDGPHKYDDQYNAIKLASHLFKSGTIIMVDDTNSEAVKKGTVDALTDLDIKYDVWLDINTAHNMHPTFWNGIFIVEVK